MRSVVVIAPVFPGGYSGHAIALQNSLDVFAQEFQRVDYIVALDDVPGSVEPKVPANVHFHRLGIRRQSSVTRFVRALTSRTPAFCLQYSQSSAILAWSQAAKNIDSLGMPDTRVFVEHLPAFQLLHRQFLTGSLPSIAVRSHDVLTDAFDLFAREGNFLSQTVWRYEVRKIRRFENDVIKRATKFAAITDADSKRYSDLFGVVRPPVLGVSIDVDRYSEIAEGDPNTVIHLGGIDVRKRQGLVKFLTSVWPKVKRRVPKAKLILAGHGSEEFNNPASGITGMGRVGDDRQELCKGLIFVNPQEAGSGVKLKSLTAMAAGKLLVSTENGVGGIPVQSAVHCLISKRADDLAEPLVSALTNTTIQKSIPLNGRDMVRQNYSFGRLVKQYRGFLAT